MAIYAGVQAPGSLRHTHYVVTHNIIEDEATKLFINLGMRVM